MHTIFDQLSLVLVIAAAVSIVMRMLRQPLIVGYILTGILVGGSVLDIVHGSETFDVFSQFGVVLLLFIIGLGLNPNVMRETGKVALITGVGQIVLMTVIAGAISVAFGLGLTESLIIGLAASFSSTIITLKLIGDKKELGRLYGKLTIGVLLIQDVVATIALIFISSESSEGFSAESLLRLSSFAMLIAAGMVMVSWFVLPRVGKFLSSSQELMFLSAIAWGVGVGLVFEQVGFSIEVGALMAGVCLATQPYAQEMASRLKPLRDFFLILFFVQIGSQLDLSIIGDVAPLAIAISLAVLIINPLIVYQILTIFGYSKRTSFLSGIGLGQISEFSMIFALLASSAGLLSYSSASAVTLIGVITIIGSSYLIIYAAAIFTKIEKYLDAITANRAGQNEPRQQRVKNNEVVIVGYKKGGGEFSKLFENMKRKYTIIDYDPEVIDQLGHTSHPHIFGDAADLEFLDEVGISASKMVISTLASIPTNKIILGHLKQNKSKTIFIASADTVEQAKELYDQGASYVMLPHYIGNSQLTHFIEQNGFSKAGFKKMRTESTNII